MKTDYEYTGVIMPRSMKEEIKKMAEEEHRSVSSQILFLLEKSLHGDLTSGQAKDLAKYVKKAR